MWTRIWTVQWLEVVNRWTSQCIVLLFSISSGSNSISSRKGWKAWLARVGNMMQKPGFGWMRRAAPPPTPWCKNLGSGERDGRRLLRLRSMRSLFMNIRQMFLFSIDVRLEMAEIPTTSSSRWASLPSATTLPQLSGPRGLSLSLSPPLREFLALQLTLTDHLYWVTHYLLC